MIVVACPKSPQFFGDDPTPDVNLVSGLGQYVCGLDTSFFHALTIPRDQTYTKPHTPYRSENRTICTTGLRVDAFAPKSRPVFLLAVLVSFRHPFHPLFIAFFAVTHRSQLLQLSSVVWRDSDLPLYSTLLTFLYNQTRFARRDSGEK